jgi:hypothetical protein
VQSASSYDTGEVWQHKSMFFCLIHHWQYPSFIGLLGFFFKLDITMWNYKLHNQPPAILLGWYVASSSSFSPPTCLAREALPLASYHQYSLVDHWSKQAPSSPQGLVNPRWNSITFSMTILCTSKHYSKKGPECFTRFSKGSMAQKRLKTSMV